MPPCSALLDVQIIPLSRVSKTWMLRAVSPGTPTPHSLLHHVDKNPFSSLSSTMSALSKKGMTFHFVGQGMGSGGVYLAPVSQINSPI
jgi:hypothetical protein